MALNMDTGTDSIIIRRQPSNQSSRRSFKDEHGQETLKSVYEKRVTTAGIQQRGGTTFGSLQTMMQRPTTQPGQQRISSMIRPSMSATSSALQHVETVFSPSEESQKLRAHENIMYQQNLLSHTSNQRLPTTSKSHDRFVKGRPSIKTLIKVATAREGN